MADQSDDSLRAEMLEEYRSLRAEVLKNIEMQRGGYTVWLTIIVTILAFAISQKQPWICIPAWLLTLYAWRSQLSLTSTIAKIGQYLAIFVEPMIRGVRWESTVAEADEVARSQFLSSHKSRGIRVFSKVSNPFAVMSLATIVTGVALALLRAGSAMDQLVTICILLVIALVHSFAVHMMLRRGWLEERDYWRRVFLMVQGARSGGTAGVTEQRAASGVDGSQGRGHTR